MVLGDRGNAVATVRGWGKLTELGDSIEKEAEDDEGKAKGEKEIGKLWMLEWI